MNTFSDQLRPLVERVGTTEAARICGVTPRSVQLWLAQPQKPPNAATQAGALVLLKQAKSVRQNETNAKRNPLS